MQRWPKAAWSACLTVVATTVVGCSQAGPTHQLSSSDLVAIADPYVPWPEDPQGCGSTSLPCTPQAAAEKTPGPLDLHGAAYMDCDGVGAKTLQQDHWIASQLRNWDDQSASPDGVINLCVSQFDNEADAFLAYRQVMASHNVTGPGVSKISIPGVPSLSGVSETIGGLQIESVVFQTGTFVTTLASGAQITSYGPLRVGHGLDASAVVAELAKAQYQRLVTS